MSKNQVKIPVITVDPETEDNDDQRLLSLEEALTDIEDLDTDNVRSNISRGIKSKLKIRLTDDEATDLEDMEASDEEDDVSSCRSPTLEDLENINNDLQIAVEMQEKHKGLSKGETSIQELLKTTTGIKRLSLTTPITDGGLTDVDQLDTSDEEAETEYPEVNFKYEFYDHDNREVIHEYLKADAVPTPSPNVTPIKLPKPVEEGGVTDRSDVEIEDTRTSKECSKKNKKRKRRVQSSNQIVNHKEQRGNGKSNVSTLGCKHLRQFNDRGLSVSPEGQECLTDVEEIQLQEGAKPPSRIVSRKALAVNRFLEKEPTTDVEEYDTDDDDVHRSLAKTCCKPKSGNFQTKKCQAEQCKSFNKHDNKVCESTKTKIGNKKQSSTTIRQADRKMTTRHLCAPVAEVIPTDEEMISDVDDILVSPYKRIRTPDLPVFEGGSVSTKESLTNRNKFLTVSLKEEPVTDTEDLIIAADEKAKKKARKTTKSTLFVPQKDIEAETETEELYPSDWEQGMKIKSNRTNNVQSGTETENVFTSDDECNQQSESDNETVISKPIRQNKRLLLSPSGHSGNVSPLPTELEEVETSSDEAASIKPTAATPETLYKELNTACVSKVHTEQFKKIDLSSPAERLYIKGEMYEDIHTDVENVNFTDEESSNSLKYAKRFSVDLTDDKITVTVTQIHSGCSTKWKNCSFSFGIFGKQGNRQYARVAVSVVPCFSSTR